MDPLSDSYFNYDDIPQNFAEFDFSTASPHSDSVIYQNYYSPGSNESHPLGEQCLVGTIINTTANGPQNTRSSKRTIGKKVQTKGSKELLDHLEDNSDSNARILKRNIAKERTKTRKAIAPLFQDVDSKYIPEGYDDPDLDENKKKKMTQMIRNRISAQNSRDRKKNYIVQLEEINQQLVQENTILAQERVVLLDKIRVCEEREAILLQENEILRQDNTCSSSRGLPNNLAEEYNQNLPEESVQVTEENFLGGFSNLSSPILNRFPSGARGFATFFTFAAILSLIAVMNIQQSTPGTVLSSHNDIGNGRVLELQDMQIQAPIQTKFNINDLSPSSSQILRSIGPLMTHFDMNFDYAFQSHMERLAIYEKNKDMEDLHLLPEFEAQNALVNNNYYSQSTYNQAKISQLGYSQSNFRGRTPTIMAQNLPIASQVPLDITLSSTLFCPAAIEFHDSNTQVMESNSKHTLDVEQADYLQLFVPRSSIGRYNLNSNITDQYGFSIQPNESNDTAMLEIWCKVFSIRELRSES